MRMCFCSQQEIKFVLSGCWVTPRLFPVTDSLDDLYGQNLKVQLRSGKCRYHDHRIVPLLLIDDVVLLALSDYDF